MARELGYKFLGFKPKVAKVQSPPYPVTGNEDVIYAAWGTPEISVDLLRVSLSREDTFETANSVSVGVLLKSIIVEYSTEDTASTDMQVSASALLKSVIIEYSGEETAATDADVSASVNFNANVVVETSQEETANTDLDVTVGVTMT